MGPAAFVIAIMEFADGWSACAQVATLPARYDSERACYAATINATREASRYVFPTTIAQCQSASGTRPAFGTLRVADSGRSGEA